MVRTMPRFVILRHEVPAAQARGSHWDLMFEHGDALRTWAIEVEPGVGDAVDARELADHRLAYLDYEGPVSGDRGTVSRWDAGEYRVEREAHDVWTLLLAGRRLQGRMSLVRGPEPYFWRVSFAADPMRG